MNPSFENQEQILFLYASPNSGHKSCAEAVRKVLNNCYPSSVYSIGIDTITHLYPILGSVVAKTYLEILRHTPQLWNFLYDNPDVEELTREIRQIFSFFNGQKLRSLLEEYSPTALVCTHAVPCSVIAEQKKRGNCTLPLIGIITDYAIHSYWLHSHVDLYIVANQESANTLKMKGIEKNKIKVCGIPVDPCFNKKILKSEACKKLLLDPAKNTLLVMGGTHGWGPIREIVEELASLKGPWQILVVTGANKDLEKELAFTQTFKNIKIFGFSNEISLLMDASDLLITKPGGITLSESLIKELPMILVNPIPGQEERNASYLVSHQAALQIKNIKELKECVKKLFSQPEELKKLKEKINAIRTPDAAQKSAEEIIHFLNIWNQKKKLKKTILT
ncbi:MAG: hypothetical protein HYT97_02210 [Elusimicrobia bacterium]|nr:hypothetical protein [Elusimicrobiota bacterium]